jgi:hypothetical protein
MDARLEPFSWSFDPIDVSALDKLSEVAISL